MSKVRIWMSDRYPDYGLSFDDQGRTEVSDDFLARYRATVKDYNDMQNELCALYDGQVWKKKESA